MIKLLRTSIAARSTAAILLIVSAVGFGFLVLAIPLTAQQERAKQQAHLHELLDTVQDTVSIACFLADPRLADEVAQGLLSNRTVSEIAIIAGNVQLAYRRKAAAGPASAAAGALAPGSLVRNVASPFNPDATVCKITLVPDAAEIRSNVARASWFTALLLLGQIVFIGIGVVMVVIRLITRPISGVSTRLHGLQAETGQKLEVPRGNETDEIGQMVRDVNTMIDYLVNILGEERSLRVQREIGEKKFRAIFDHADTGIFLIDESGFLMSCNPAFAQFFGMPELAAEEGPGSLMFVDLIGEHREEARALIGRAIADNKSAEQDIKLDGKAGTPTRWVNVVLSTIENLRLQGVVNDITERKHTEEAAQQLAVTDHLTGLGNRLGFERRLEQMVDESYRRPGHRFALLMLDLDWFKQVNDTYGHQAGDDVLIHFARLLEKTVRKSDYVGRVGGDEFVVLLDSTFRREIIEPIIRKIIAGIGQPIPIGEGKSVSIGASIGVAVFADTLTKDELIRRADVAMYRAKENGRNAYHFFEI